MADLARCSFCGKSSTAIEKLAAGTGVHICNQCVELCQVVLREDAAATPRAPRRELPDPEPPRRPSQRPPTRCSFCGRGQQHVRKLVAGPGAYICTDCVSVCDQAMRTSADLILHPSFPVVAEPS